MAATIFYDSVERSVVQRLIPTAQRLLTMGNALLRGKFPITLSIGESSAFDVSVSQHGPTGFEVHLTKGVLVRLCFAAQVFNDAFMAATIGTRIHHATFIEPFETAFIEQIATGITEVKFAMCEPLRAVFAEMPQSGEQWDLLKSLEWEPLGLAESEIVCLSKRSLSAPAIQLACLALSFLIFHEFAHVRLGHLHFLDRTASLKACPERGAARAALDARTFQALEIDADIEALRLLLLMYGSQDLELDPAVLFCAVGVVVTLFDLISRSSVHYQAATHPLPDFRYVLSANYWGGNLARLPHPGLAQHYRRGWQEGLLWCKAATDQMGMHTGAFYCVGREIYIATDAVQRFHLIPPIPGSLAESMQPRDGRDFSMVNFADRELYEMTSALARVRPLLMEIQRSYKLRDN